MKCLKVWKIFSKFDKLLQAGFYNYGKILSKYPVCFLVASIVISGIISSGCSKFKEVKATQDLYTHEESTMRKLNQTIAKLFPPRSATNFSMVRDTTIGFFAQVIAVAKNDGNVFNPNVIKELITLNKMVENLTVTDSLGVTYQYSNLCAFHYSHCAMESIVHVASLEQEAIMYVLEWLMANLSEPENRYANANYTRLMEATKDDKTYRSSKLGEAITIRWKDEDVVERVTAQLLKTRKTSEQDYTTYLVNKVTNKLEGDMIRLDLSVLKDELMNIEKYVHFCTKNEEAEELDDIFTLEGDLMTTSLCTKKEGSILNITLDTQF